MINENVLICSSSISLFDDISYHIFFIKESQLKLKTLEISRLRSEVLSLESRTPPHYQDKDSRETQKILRTKVESLETIIEQCDKENQELLEQRDADRTQV